MLEQADLIALALTLRLALISTLLLLLLGIPLAWWLANTHSKAKVLVEVIVALPLVLPPTVLGFYMLIVLGPDGPGGWLTNSLGLSGLPFSFSGLVIGSVVFSLPFVVQPIQQTFVAKGLDQAQIAATMGAGPLDRFFSVVLPQAKQGILGGAILGFAHTIGEFGLVLMLGGNIPGETQVVSISIYEHVELLNYQRAHILAAWMLVLSVALLVPVYARRSLTKRWF